MASILNTAITSRSTCEKYLHDEVEVVKSERMPTRTTAEITDEPMIWRYFVTPLRSVLAERQQNENEFMARLVMHINACLDGCHVFSSGKNMGVFKAVGFPEDVGRFYRLDEYGAYSWTAHGRYPTNTPGWWGGAHPFSLLDFSVVHNGEISSYDANRRFIEMFGYKCTLQTDTEVITYIPEAEREKLTYLRTAFPSLLVTGPFSIVLGFSGGLMALNDRLKLRSMVVGEKGDRVFIASEESAIRAIEPDAENVWAPAGGEPVIVRVKEGRY